MKGEEQVCCEAGTREGRRQPQQVNKARRYINRKSSRLAPTAVSQWTAEAGGKEMEKTEPTETGENKGGGGWVGGGGTYRKKGEPKRGKGRGVTLAGPRQDYLCSTSLSTFILFKDRCKDCLPPAVASYDRESSGAGSA